MLQKAHRHFNYKANCCLEDRSFSAISQDNGGPSFSPFSHDTCSLSITQLFKFGGWIPRFYIRIYIELFYNN